MYIIMTLPTKKAKKILRSFVVIKQKVFPNEQLDKLKARLAADDSQQGWHLYDFVSSATVPYKKFICYLI